MPADTTSGIVDRYLELGLRLGRHVDGFVDAYYGPPALADRVEAEPLRPPAELAADASRPASPTSTPVTGRAPVTTLSTRAPALDPGPGARPADQRPQAGGRADRATPTRSRRATASGPPSSPRTTFARRPPRASTRRSPATGRSRERYIAWREAQAVPPEKLDAAIRSLADDFRERTQRQFGLPDGEHVDCELVTDQPWSGFNYYLGDLRSRVAINTDLPVLSRRSATSSRTRPTPATTPSTPARRSASSAAGAGSRRRSSSSAPRSACWPRASPTSALEVMVGGRPEPVVAEHLRPLGIALRRRGRRPPSPRPARRSRAVRAQRRLAAARRRRARRRRRRLPRALGAAAPRPGREGGVVPHRRDLARLHLLLHRGPAAVPGLRRRRPDPLRAPAHRAAHPADLAAVTHRRALGRARRRLP